MSLIPGESKLILQAKHIKHRLLHSGAVVPPKESDEIIYCRNYRCEVFNSINAILIFVIKF